MPLPDNVAIYIAEKIKSNIRELEGSLIRLIAFASLTGREISIDLAQEVLKNVIGQDERAVTVEMIQKSVADYYQLKVVDMRARNNSKSVALPRQIAMYLCKSLTHASLPGDRPELRRQAPLDRDPLHPEDRDAAQEGPRFQQPDQRPDRAHALANQADAGDPQRVRRPAPCGRPVGAPGRPQRARNRPRSARRMSTGFQPPQILNK